MLFKQGTDDPSGFKHSLHHENITPGTSIRYVGNPFNVLFYLAENFLERLLYYLCYCKNSLKSSLMNDLQN